MMAGTFPAAVLGGGQKGFILTHAYHSYLIQQKPQRTQLVATWALSHGECSSSLLAWACWKCLALSGVMLTSNHMPDPSS